MEAQSPKSKTGKRRYERKRPFQDTPARQAARMANFEKMVAAPKEKRYRPSPRRDAANPKNLEKGRAVLRQRAADREQQQLCERLQTLFPEYPPQEAGIRSSGLGAREPEWGDSGRDTQPKSGIPNPEPRTPDPDPGGVGTKPECDVESTDSSPTSPSRIQDQDTPLPGPIPEDQDKPQSGPSGTAADDQSANGNHQSAIPEDPNPFLPDSATALRTVAERIWKRRRHFPRQARREGRQVMRLLTQAAQSPSPPL